MTFAADFVIVGAGSAGCVLANRLTEDGRHSVILLEFGGGDRSPVVRMPSALSLPMHSPRYDWGYVSEPEPHLGGRRLRVPRGKVIGGSSSINGMVFVRGHALDFDRWVEEGARGWGYADVLPYFKRLECRAEGGDAWRGDSGPMHVRTGRLSNPLYRAFIEAGKQAGYPESADLNGYQQEGFGRLEMTVHRGERWSAAAAYLRPALRRPNLRIVTGAFVTRVLFEGRRATGVAFRRGGAEVVAQAGREVILAAGPIGSPKLLKLSGVGPGEELASFGLPVVADRPGVGENLQDHLEFYFQVGCRQPISLFSHINPAAKVRIGLRWLLARDGLGATNHFEAGGFIRSRPGIRHPDIQYHFLPVAISYDGRRLATRHGFQAHVGPMRSRSRGSVRLAGPDPRTPPRIRFNYMSEEDDWVEMRACVRLTREIFAQPALAPYRDGEISPGEAVQTDEAIDDFIRERVESAYHPSCTCRMGDPRARGTVVDHEARVVGVGGLRIADSSIMPSITTGNLNAPTLMIGEKVTDHVLGRPPLPASNAPFHVAAGWEERQR